MTQQRTATTGATRATITTGSAVRTISTIAAVTTHAGGSTRTRTAKHGEPAATPIATLVSGPTVAAVATVSAVGNPD